MPPTEAQLKDAFNLFDADGSGQIDNAELRLLFKGLGMNVGEEEVNEMLREIDVDGDMKVGFDEFTKLIEKQSESQGGPAEVLKAFNAFDISGNGEITKADLREVAHSLSERVTDQDIDEIWKYCAENDEDENGEGHFTFHAWRTVMEHLYNRGTSRGNDDDSSSALPTSDAAVWQELERKEEETREARMLAKEDRVNAQLERQEKAREYKANIEKIRADNTDSEASPTASSIPRVGESRRRQMQEEQDQVKERLARKKELVKKQIEEEAVRRKADDEQDQATRRKLEEKRAAAQARDNM